MKHALIGAISLFAALPAWADTEYSAIRHQSSYDLADHLLGSFCEPNCNGGWKTDYTESSEESFSMEAKKAATADETQKKQSKGRGLAQGKINPPKLGAASTQRTAQD
jgi:hypothetical protein